MPDIKIDISDILNKYLFPILCSGLVGLLLFQLRFHEWIWPTIISISLFLLIELSIYCIGKKRNKMKQNDYAKARDKAIKHNMVMMAENALEIFRSINDYQLDAAVTLYNHPQLPNSHYYERYVRFGEMPITLKLSYWDDFCQHSLLDNDTPYIYCTNRMDCYNGGARHYLIDPLFYELLRNYVENGIKDYPESFDIMTLSQYYKQV